MSAKSKKKSPTAIRYSADDKRKIVDYVKAYNASKGRGGQSAAAKKFKVSPLTIAAWLNGTATKSQSKGGKKAAGGKMGVRYSPQQKQEVVKFVKDYNAANGRGGQNQAAKKFKLSILTVSAWLKAAGVKSGGKAAKVAKVVKVASEKASKPAAVKAGLAAKVASLIQINEQVRLAENELEKLYSKQDAIMASIKSWI